VSDLIAGVVYRAVVAVKTARPLADELAIELAAREREEAHSTGRARGGVRVAADERAAARIAFLSALENSVAAGCKRDVRRCDARENQECPRENRKPGSHGLPPIVAPSRIGAWSSPTKRGLIK
jgi:hypothetical protein